MKKWLLGIAGSVVLAGGIAGVSANAASEEGAQVDGTEVVQEQGQVKGHHHKRGFHKEEKGNENHELMGSIFEKQEKLIDLLLDKNASAIDGVEELQTELADVNEQLNALHEEAKAAHEKLKAQKQEWKDSGERPELTDEEKEEMKAKFSEMKEKREEAMALAKKKDELLTALIEKVS